MADQIFDGLKIRNLYSARMCLHPTLYKSIPAQTPFCEVTGRTRRIFDNNVCRGDGRVTSG